LEIDFQGERKNLSLKPDKLRAAASANSRDDAGPSEAELEDEVEGFTALLERARRIREMGSGLSDDERRRQAESALREILSMEGLNMEDM
jgi:hypothetical protein